MKIRQGIVSGLGMALGLLLLVAVGVISNRRTEALVDSKNWVSHTLEVIADLRLLHSDLLQAEDNWRGYALFHDNVDLTRMIETMTRVPPEVAKVRQLTADNARQQARLDLLEPLIARRQALLEQSISAITDGSEANSRIRAVFEQSKTAADGSRRILEEMEAEEWELLVGRQQRAAREKSIATSMIGGGFFLALIFMLGAGVFGQWEIVRRQKMEVVLQTAHKSIAANLQEAQERGLERAILSELSERLQSCRNLAEGLPFMARSMERLFPGECGSLFIISASRNILENVVSWGSDTAAVSSFPPDDCWALRRGSVQIVDASDETLRCPHLNALSGPDAICLPMVAQGETLGVMSLQSCLNHKSEPRSQEISRNRVSVAVLAAAQISLAVANLQLRETLRNQSIRDPLTGLFNRRYMEESLTREFHRATRRKSPLVVIMLDIDHFKSFNDTYGHELGDRLLSEFGKFLAKNIRAEDIACRYGGEEFTLILPDATMEGASKRAEQLRRKVQDISIPLRDGSTASVTISLGLAIGPETGQSPEDLVRKADVALYSAKAAGRDRLVTAPLQAAAESTNQAVAESTNIEEKGVFRS
jgi:diguanylate cyclase (GGDEF)-like protein